MKRQFLKQKIALGLISLLTLLLLQAGLTFAWFHKANLLKIKQTIVVGEFLVELNSDSKAPREEEEDMVYYSDALDIFINNAYPMTLKDAKAGEGTVFKARIKNNGNISAMFRIYILFDFDNLQSGAEFAPFFRFAAFYGEQPEVGEQAAVLGSLSDAAEAVGPLSYFTCKFEDGKTIFNEFGFLAGRTLSQSGDEKFFRIYIWLDHEVTLNSESGGLFFGRDEIKLEFKFVVEAIQSSAAWEDFGQ